MIEHLERLATFDASYRALFALLASYPASLREKNGACGLWSPRQVLAHLSGWLVEADRRYDNYAAGDTKAVHYDFDSFNAASVNARAALSWTKTVDELQTLHQAFSARARGLSDDQVADGRHTQWLEALDEDCREHYEQLHSFAGG